MKQQSAAAAPAATAVTIALAQIELSSTNPRKTFDKVQLSELTESVQKHGVLTPVLVRPFGEAKFELVAGERRLRAAKAAGLKEIPAISRALTDQEALEIQLIENLQRADLHPLEEAEGYERLLALPGETAATIAAKVGKSPTYVYGRLKLCSLTPANRKRFYAGSLNAATALLLARIPMPALQDQAGKEITYQNGSEQMSTTSAGNHVRRVYMLELKRAPFPTGDATLVEGAGTCAACPKRTGNQKELFGDVKSGETCTDPVCFGAKRDAFSARQLKDAEKNGQAVFTGAEARKILPYDTSSGQGGWTKLDASCYADKTQRTFRAILGKSAPVPSLVQTEAGMVEVVKVAEITDLLKAKGIVLDRGASSSRGGQTMQADQKARELKARTETAVRRAIHAALRDKVPEKLPHQVMLVVAAVFYDRLEHEMRKSVTRLWTPDTGNTGKKGPSIDDLSRDFDKRIPKMTPKELPKLLVDMAVIREINVGSYHTPKLEAIGELSKTFKVDVSRVRRTVESAARKAAAEKAAKAKKSKAKKAEKANAAK